MTTNDTSTNTHSDPQVECEACGSAYNHECVAEYTAWWEPAPFCVHRCPTCDTTTNGDTQ